MRFIYLSSAAFHILLSYTSLCSSAAVAPATAGDLANLQARRLDVIIGALTNVSDIAQWLSTLGSDGKWPDVNYATGCAAQRANWPAQDHWNRILVMAGAWHGGIPDTDQYQGNDSFASTISSAMNWWFDRDFTNADCLTNGGTTSCPCDDNDQTLWNTNWFSNVIGTPKLVGQSCILMNDTLVPTQLSNCSHMTARAYGTFEGDFGFLAGANVLDIASIGIDNGIMNQDVSIITDAYRRIHNEVQVQAKVMVDGVKPDGSFGQHTGLLYNGNYGKDYTNDILALEVEAADTEWSANETSQDTLEILLEGDAWMIYRNTLTEELHWDFSALGRFISFPVADLQATASLNLNLTRVDGLGRQRSSDVLINFAQSLSQDEATANAGDLVGNRHFFSNDYMVHRGDNYVSTLKMYSTRTKNTECTNTQNPFGFHLADGVLYNYIAGNEYEDIAAAWDWNLIPGTTVNYGATALTCSRITFAGIENFVGGASTGKIGLAAMRYTNPNTKAFHFNKAWFFLEGDAQHIMVSNISSSNSAPVYSVLDQRSHAGSIFVDSQETQLKENTVTNFTNTTSLWHGGVGYIFNPNSSASLSLNVGSKTGDWSKIGTSQQPPTTVDMFAAWLDHHAVGSSVEYSAFPGTQSADGFAQKSAAIQLNTLQNDPTISALSDDTHNVVMMVFWDPKGGCVTADTQGVTICSTGNAAVIYEGSSVTVSDPSQSLQSLKISLTFSSGEAQQNLTIALPQGGQAGSSVTTDLLD